MVKKGTYTSNDSFELIICIINILWLSLVIFNFTLLTKYNK